VANKRTLRNHRKRLAKRGVARIEVVGEPLKTGRILAALRRSPLVGANINLARSRDTDG
jgi:hypothetical protein